MATTRTGEVSFAGVLSAWHGDKQYSLQRLIGTGVAVVFAGLRQRTAGGRQQGAACVVRLAQQLGRRGGGRDPGVALLPGRRHPRFHLDRRRPVAGDGMLAMGLLLWVAVQDAGGLAAARAQLHAVPGFMDWFPKDLARCRAWPAACCSPPVGYSRACR